MPKSKLPPILLLLVLAGALAALLLWKPQPGHVALPTPRQTTHSIARRRSTSAVAPISSTAEGSDCFFINASAEYPVTRRRQTSCSVPG